MKIIFWGTPEYSVNSLNAIYDSEHEIIAVVTQPDRKRRRGNNLIPSPIKERATKLGIEVIQTENIRQDLKIQEYIKNLQADIYIVVAFGQILPREVLTQPKYGCWNSHASILPRWRGAAPIQWSILSGDDYTGIGIMAMEEGLDTGGVLIEKTIRIQIFDNVLDISKKLSELSGKLIIQAIQIISELDINSYKDYTTLKLLRWQDDNNTTYARQITKQDYLINWDRTSVQIHRQIMGLFPNCYTNWRGARFKVSRSIPLIDTIDLNKDNNLNLIRLKYKEYRESPGKIIGIEKDYGIIVSTKDGQILIQEGQLAGKRILNGFSLIQSLGDINKEDSF